MGGLNSKDESTDVLLVGLSQAGKTLMLYNSLLAENWIDEFKTVKVTDEENDLKACREDNKNRVT
jgi:predicted AAA+ superfamily ATPase